MLRYILLIAMLAAQVSWGAMTWTTTTQYAAASVPTGMVTLTGWASTNGTWRHYAEVGATQYVDGVAASFSNTIWRYSGTAYTNGLFAGSSGEARGYSRALTAAEVAALYRDKAYLRNPDGAAKKSSILDTSGNNYTASLVGAESTMAMGYDSRAWTFSPNGSTRLEVASTNVWGGPTAPHTGTVAFWVKRLANSLHHIAVSRGGYAGGAKSAYAISINTAQSLVIESESTGGTLGRTAVDQFLKEENWIHCIVSWNGQGSFPKMYKNGSPIALAYSNAYNTGSNVYSFDATDQTMTIGCRHTAGTYDKYSSQVIYDDIMIFETAITDAEALALGTHGTMPTSAVLSYYNPMIPDSSQGIKNAGAYPQQYVGGTNTLVFFSELNAAVATGSTITNGTQIKSQDPNRHTITINGGAKQDRR